MPDPFKSAFAWSPLRLVVACVGVLALAASAAGIYYVTRSEPQAKPASAAGGFAFAMHSAPRPVSELTFQDAQGKKRSLGDFRGRTVLVNIWATWCVPCREEMPALDRLQEKLGGPGFEVVALSIDTQGVPAVKKFYDEIGIRSLAIYVDPAMQAGDKLHIIGIPTTLLIDGQGREIGRRTGPAKWDGPEAIGFVEKHIEATLPAKQ